MGLISNGLFSKKCNLQHVYKECTCGASEAGPYRTPVAPVYKEQKPVAKKPSWFAPKLNNGKRIPFGDRFPKLYAVLSFAMMAAIGSIALYALFPGVHYLGVYALRKVFHYTYTMQDGPGAWLLGMGIIFGPVGIYYAGKLTCYIGEMIYESDFFQRFKR